jgi:lysozyme
MSDNTRELIKRIEGYSATAYKDAGGHSIGYGHYIQKGEEALLGHTLTDEESEKLLTKDIESHQAGIKQWLKKPATDTQMAALTSLAYNTGARSPAVKEIVALHNEGKTAAAAKAFAKYNKSYNPQTGTKELNESLVKRRELEKQLYSAREGADVNGVYDSVMGGPKKKALAVESAAPGQVAGRAEVSANQNRDIFAQLQALNTEMKSINEDEEYANRLRDEGRNKI